MRIRGREKDDSNKGGVEGAGKGGSGSQVVNGRVAVSIAPRKGGERRQSGGDAESEKEDKQETEKDKIFTGIDDKAEKEGGVETRGPTQEAEDLEDPPLDVDVPAEATHGKSEEGEMEIGGEAIGAVNGGTSEGVAEDLSGLGAQQEEPEEEELNRKNEAEVADAQKERKSSRWDRKASQEIGEEGEIGIYLEAGTADDQKVKESNDAQQGGGAFDRTEGERFERRGNDRRFEERGQDERRGEAERFEKGGENERFERKGDDRHENRRRDESYGDDRRRDERYDRGPDRYERPRDGRFDDPRQRRDDRYDDGRSRDRRVGDRGDRFGGERENERRSDDRRRTERDYARLDDRRYEGRGYGDRGNQDRGYDGRGPERSRREDRTEQNGRLNFEERERGREPAAKAAPYERPETMQADREERVRSSGRAGWGAQRGGSFKQPTEKWGHDKFNELNQGNEVGEVVEEDPYAKIEALLAL